MPDISKCEGVGCPVASECYRHTAPSSGEQWYVNYPRKRDGSCSLFWKEEKDEIHD